jgi:hypothetical protein
VFEDVVQRQEAPQCPLLVHDGDATDGGFTHAPEGGAEIVAFLGQHETPTHHVVDAYEVELAVGLSDDTDDDVAIREDAGWIQASVRPVVDHDQATYVKLAHAASSVE